MPYLAKEAEIILNNLILYFQYYFGNETLLYFTDSAEKEAKNDRWDTENNRVVSAMELYLEEEEDRLGFEKAKSFITNLKERIALMKQSNIQHSEVTTAKLEDTRKEAEEKVAAMKNKVVSAFY